MLNGHQGDSFSETQMVGNCMEVCMITKKKSERDKEKENVSGGPESVVWVFPHLDKSISTS